MKQKTESESKDEILKAAHGSKDRSEQRFDGNWTYLAITTAEDGIFCCLDGTLIFWVWNIKKKWSFWEKIVKKKKKGLRYRACLAPQETWLNESITAWRTNQTYGYRSLIGLFLDQVWNLCHLKYASLSPLRLIFVPLKVSLFRDFFGWDPYRVRNLSLPKKKG